MNTSDLEIIARARIQIPKEKREERYRERPTFELRDDLNCNWDLTRALLRQSDDQQSQILEGKKKLKTSKTKLLLLSAILGGASAKGLELAALAIIHAFAR